MTNSQRELLSAGKFMWGFSTEHEVRSETISGNLQNFDWYDQLLKRVAFRRKVHVRFLYRTWSPEWNNIRQSSNFDWYDQLSERVAFLGWFSPASDSRWKLSSPFHQKPNNTQTPTLSLERRWSSRTFRYGYLVTTSPQSSVLPSAASSLGTLTSGITNSHGVTGGVYKTRERIHRSMLICDY